MQPYPNHSGRSGVRAYEAGSDFIEVEFRNGSRYRYTHQIPGRSHVETMKQLATEGRFLATYINTHVRQRYAVRLR